MEERKEHRVDAGILRHRLSDIGTSRDRTGHFDRERVVHKEQGLLRHDGRTALGVCHIWVGVVELRKRIVQAQTIHVAVDATTVRVRFVRNVGGLAADNGAQLTRELQHRVSDGFKIEAVQISAPEEAITRIELQRINGTLSSDERIEVRIGVQAVGGARHDEAVHPLDGPAVRHELAGEPIE